MKHFSIVFLITVLFTCCSKAEKNEITAETVIDKAIIASGKSKLKYSELNFNFRGVSYSSLGKCDHFIYKRISKTKDSVFTDIYNTKNNLKRYFQNEEYLIADTTAFKYAESINSVNYFIQLPERLNDQAVIKTYLGLDTIHGKTYHTIKVKFSEENGGTDFQDIYYYWFGEKDYKLTYLAYSFAVNGGGIRFREAFNERLVNGVRFVDYKNYKPKPDKTLSLENLSDGFEKGELILLSTIENVIESLEVNDKDCNS